MTDSPPAVRSMNGPHAHAGDALSVGIIALVALTVVQRLVGFARGVTRTATSGTDRRPFRPPRSQETTLRDSQSKPAPNKRTRGKTATTNTTHGTIRANRSRKGTRSLRAGRSLEDGPRPPRCHRRRCR